MDYADSVVALRARFRQLYDVPPFATFEKEAVARFGSAAITPLNEIRGMMKMPPVNYNIPRLEKTAGFVDDTTVEMKLLAEIIATQDARVKLAYGIAKIEGAL